MCCNLKRGLYLGTKKNKRGVILRDGGSIISKLVVCLFVDGMSGGWWDIFSREMLNTHFLTRSLTFALLLSDIHLNLIIYMKLIFNV